nr:reverse transcriptase domain-containing protein [Tanacetum cinerariifolium]
MLKFFTTSASVVLEKVSEASKFKMENHKSLALNASKISSDKKESCSSSDEKYVMAVRDFKKFFRIGKFVRQPYDDKISSEKGCWSDSEDGDDSKDVIYLMALNNNEFSLTNSPEGKTHITTSVSSTRSHLRFRHPKVPNTTVKLLLFPFSLECEARIWLDKEPPRSILTWEDLVSKFINQFFPPSKTTYLRNEITNFLQKSNETFNEAWERFKDLLRQCPHHKFSKLHQLDTFYNALNPNDQDALDSAAGGNFLDKIPRECLSIIESKLKVRYSRSRVTDVRSNANATLSSSQSNSFDLQQIAAALEDKLDIRMNQFEKSLIEMKNSLVTPTAPLKAVTK